MKPVELLIIGAGSRGSRYAQYAAERPELVRVVGVADPRDFYRNQLAQKYGVAPENVLADWRPFIERPKFADAVIIATPDVLHLDPALAFAQQGYDILLEKPMAPDPASCRQIVEAALENKSLFAVCHVMRYTNYSQKMKELVASGLIGDIVSVQHLEPVGFWHYAHSYVRGNWRNEKSSSFMLLAKSCHDIDWLRYIIGRPCIEVSSFGSLKYFRKENKPLAAGAALRCLDCAFEPDCAYSAKRFYLNLLDQGKLGWPLDVMTTEFSREGVMTALREGPYGRCVYECDNDVVDHQVVNLLYDNGVTASFTMIGESETRDRQTIIFGTKGELRGNGEKIFHYDFLTGKTREIEIEQPPTSIQGHGGGDYNLIKTFVEAVATRDPSGILSGPLESLETHLTVFAAERARLEKRVVEVATNSQ